MIRGGPTGLRAFLSSRRHYRLVIVSRPHNMQYVKAAIGSDLSALGVPCVYDAEAIYALREIARRRLAGSPMEEADGQALIQSERSLTRGCTAVLTVVAMDGPCSPVPPVSPVAPSPPVSPVAPSAPVVPAPAV